MPELDRIAQHIVNGQRFVLSSHQRPDGDAIGSAVGMALALSAMGKQAQVVMDAVPPHFLQPFPAVDQILVTRDVPDGYDAALVMECSSLDRTGVAGLDRSPVLNIDHHPGNTGYGAINWVDESAAACGELVFTLVEALGAPLTRDVATHIYLALLTDTGSFHFSHITPRSFEIARRCVEAGADPQWIARTHYDSSTLGRVRIFGAVLNAMQLDPSGRVALLSITQAAAAAAGGTLRRYRRAHQLPAHGEGHRGGGLLQGSRAGRLARQHAVERRRRRRRDRALLWRRRTHQCRRLLGTRRARDAPGHIHQSAHDRR